MNLQGGKTMGNSVYFIYCVVFIYLIWCAYRLPAHKDLQYRLYLLVLICLFYDNLISFSGFLIGLGPLLKFLNFLRFAIHVFITPLFCYIVFNIAQSMGIKIAQGNNAEKVVWVLTLGLIALGFMKELSDIDLVPNVRWGIVKYSQAKPSIPIAVILVNLFVIISSVVIWRATGWPVLCITSIAMFMIAAIPSSKVGQLPGNAGEIIFAYGFLLAQKRLLKIERRA
jgi:hypothetical protein